MSNNQTASMNLPAFGDESLQLLIACALICPDSSEILQSFQKEEESFQARIQPDDGPGWLRLIAQRWDDEHGHFHIEIGRESAFARSPGHNEVSLSDIQARIAQYIGQEVGVLVTGQFDIPIESLPKRGIVRTLRGISAESCGAEMTLTGAEMDVDSDEFTKVKWGTHRDGETLWVEIDAETETTVDSDYLIRLVELMRQGMECFIFESSKDSGEHGVKDRPVLPSRKKVGN